MRIHYSLDGKKITEKKLVFEQANFFQTPLFNQTTHRFLHTLFGNLVKNFTLTSAKGGKGWKFTDKPLLVKEMQRLPDMPYHMHILNGLLPAMKLLEKFVEENGWSQDERFKQFLQAFIVGFTFHDTNKLVGKDLRDSVREDLPNLCAQLKTEQFFPEWQAWLPEIQFLALRTEYGDMSFSFKDYGNKVREFDFLNKQLGEFCHLADHFASITIQEANIDPNEKKCLQNTSDLYLDIANYSFGSKKLKDYWNLSWVGVGETICTLLAQKLLNEAQKFIQTIRKEDILIHTRNGFIFLGEPLTLEERAEVSQKFTEGDDDPITQTLITFQQASFGFTKTRDIVESDLDKIIEAGILGFTNKIQLFKVSESLVTQGQKSQVLFEKFIHEKELPWKFIPKSKTEKASRFVIADIDDWETDSEKRIKWELFALQKIKFLKRTAQKSAWSKEFENAIQLLKSYFAKDFDEFPSDYSRITLAALISVAEEKCDLAEKVKQVKADIIQNFPAESATGNNIVLNEFAQTYLIGNFELDWQNLFGQFIEVPAKSDMCLFSGSPAKSLYDNSIAHGVGAVKFSNRSVNTLKSKSHHISPVFLEEIALRNGLSDNKSSDNSVCIYFDFGEQLVHIDSRELFELLATVKEFEYNERDWRITIDQRSINLNLFGLRFADIAQTTKGNFDYILQSLKLIEKTAFRIYTAGVISPYRVHKEMFVFENCMPYVKALGWDRIRIDEVNDRLFELSLIKRIAAKRLNSVLLEFADDARALFSAFRSLDAETLRKDNNLESDFYEYCLSILSNYHQHRYNMSPMKQLAELAIQMARPQSDSSSQETKIIRSALDVLKRCHKEKQSRETSIGQITGELRQLAKSYPYFEESLAMPFAEGIYDNIYRKAWQGIFPPPSRLRHWVNEFAAWYSREADVFWKKKAIEDAHAVLVKEDKPTDLESIITWLKNSDRNKNGSVDKYESLYRLAFQKFQSIGN